MGTIPRWGSRQCVPHQGTGRHPGVPGRAPQQPALQLGTPHPQQPPKLQVDANMEDIKHGGKVTALTAKPSCRGTSLAPPVEKQTQKM